MIFLSMACKWWVSLPILVVLPAPLTPVTINTKGRWASTSRVFSKGCSNSIKMRLSAVCTSWASSIFSFLTRARSAFITRSVALTPTSAIKSASSRDSNKASSTRTPTNTWRKLVPVLLKPLRRRANQPPFDVLSELGRAWVSGSAAGT